MSFCRALPRRLGAPLLALATLLGSTFAASLSAPAAAVPTYGVDERAQAIASPSLVFLEATYTGIVRDAKSGKPLQHDPLVVYRRCSGFIINPDGHVLTTSVCVRPSDEAVRWHALNKLGRERKLTGDRLDSFVKTLMSTAVFTGAQPGTEPNVTLFGQLNVATAGATSTPAIPGTIVDGQEPGDGNVAVVKLDRGDLPAIELDTGVNLGHGSSVIILGFDTKDANTDVGTYTVQAKTVDVTGSGHANRLRVSEDVGPYSHGGMAVDTSGRVVAMLDTDTTATDRPNRALIEMAALTGIQSQSGVGNRLGDVDRAYRNGLDAYFGGRYSIAIREFDAALSQTPSHLLANIYRKNASDRYAIEGDVADDSTHWLPYLLSAVGGALIVLLITFGWRIVVRRRRSANPHLLAPVSTSPYAPVSGAGMYPVSGPPVGADPWSSPAQSGTAQPVPASPGVPLPLPPVQLPKPQPIPPHGVEPQATVQPTPGPEQAATSSAMPPSDDDPRRTNRELT